MLPFPSSRLPFGLNLWIAARLLPQVMKFRQLDDILRRATPEKAMRAYDDLKAERFMALNGLAAGSALTPGQKVKIVTY